MTKARVDRKGAMMMMLLVVLIIGSLVAIQLVPNEEIITRRTRETGLNSQISQIREAFDLMSEASPAGWEPWPDGHVPTKEEIANLLKSMSDSGFLRNASSVVDPTVLTHFWSSSEEKFWRPVANFASNSSFQISVDGITAWDWNTSETDASTDTVFLSNSSIDDYPYQNKLGEKWRGKGSSLRITR